MSALHFKNTWMYLKQICWGFSLVRRKELGKSYLEWVHIWREKLKTTSYNFRIKFFEHTNIGTVIQLSVGCSCILEMMGPTCLWKQIWPHFLWLHFSKKNNIVDHVSVSSHAFKGQPTLFCHMERWNPHVMSLVPMQCAYDYLEWN